MPLPRKTIVLIDTSIFTNLLNIPYRNENKEFIKEVFSLACNDQQYRFLIPLTTVIETGNFIAQIEDGNLRRVRAIEFKQHINDAYDGKAPFSPIDFTTLSDMHNWIDEFPNLAQSKISLGDMCILKDLEKLRSLNPLANIIIWTLDDNLDARNSHKDILFQIPE
jgi:hypothetical protein